MTAGIVAGTCATRSGSRRSGGPSIRRSRGRSPLPEFSVGGWPRRTGRSRCLRRGDARGSVGLAAPVPPRFEAAGLSQLGAYVRGEGVEIRAVVRGVHAVEHGAHLIFVGARLHGGDRKDHERRHDGEDQMPHRSSVSHVERADRYAWSVRCRKLVKVERNRLNLDGVEQRDKHFKGPLCGLCTRKGRCRGLV